MTVIQRGKIDAFLARPPDAIHAVLIYGPDSGLVGERAGVLAVAFAGGADPLAVTRLTSGDLSEDPDRLADEATSMGLFGGRRVLRVRPESHQIAPILEALLPRIDNDLLIIVEAGQMAPGIKLRKLFETKSGCAAIPCYADSEQDLARLLNAHLRDNGLTIDADAREAFVARLGGDRMASRNEIEKLCLYTHGRSNIVLQDVVAVSGDVSALALDDLCDAMMLGGLTLTDLYLRRLLSAGTGADRIVAAAIRHMLLIHELRAQVEAGGRVGDIVDRRRPPIFFKRKAAIASQVNRWPLKRLNRALEILGEGESNVRRNNALGPSVVSDVLLKICYQAGKLARR